MIRTATDTFQPTNLSEPYGYSNASALVDGTAPPTIDPLGGLGFRLLSGGVWRGQYAYPVGYLEYHDAGDRHRRCVKIPANRKLAARLHAGLLERVHPVLGDRPAAALGCRNALPCHQSAHPVAARAHHAAELQPDQSVAGRRWCWKAPCWAARTRTWWPAITPACSSTRIPGHSADISKAAATPSITTIPAPTPPAPCAWN